MNVSPIIITYFGLKQSASML